MHTSQTSKPVHLNRQTKIPLPLKKNKKTKGEKIQNEPNWTIKKKRGREKEREEKSKVKWNKREEE